MLYAYAVDFSVLTAPTAILIHFGTCPKPINRIAAYEYVRNSTYI